MFNPEVICSEIQLYRRFTSLVIYSSESGFFYETTPPYKPLTQILLTGSLGRNFAYIL